MDKVQRIEYYDVMRGGAIVLVIAIHSFTGFSLDEKHSITYHWAIIWRQIIGFAVPLFLAISGYFLAIKSVSNKRDYFSFIKRQLPRVYIPMLIWSLPLLFFSIYSKGEVLKSLVMYLTGGLSVYYFIILIVQYYILLPVLQRLGSHKISLGLTGVISILSLLTVFYLKVILGKSLSLVVYAGPFPVWIVFFSLGIYIGKGNSINASKLTLLLLTFMGLILSIAETYLHIHISQSFTGLGIKTGAFIYSFAIILLLFSLNPAEQPKTKIWKLFRYLGEISFGIYLIHMYFLNYLVRPVVNHIGIDNYFGKQLFLILMTTIACIILISVIRRINLQLSKKYLGF